MTAERLTPLELMTKLVSFPTVSRDTNLPLVHWVTDYLRSHGIEPHIWPDPKQPEKAALFAHVGPWVEGGVVLSGHTDVVPVDGQNWTSDPYTVIERDGRYFGRGTCDMKGFDALAIWALVEAHFTGVRRPLQLALSFDEEIGCKGAPPMIEAMQPVLPKASMVIVGEPSEGRVVTAHKGGTGWRTHIHGFEVHSSIMHEGVSAVMMAGELLSWANRQNEEAAARAPGTLAEEFVPHWSTWHVGRIHGGTADNITARDCEFSMLVRVVPGDDPQEISRLYHEKVSELRAQMKAIRPEADITLARFFRVPALEPEVNGEAEAFVRALTGDNGNHVVSYATEGGQFQEAGFSTVVCGPGNIAQAHQPDEFITIAEFEKGHQFMRDLLARISE